MILTADFETTTDVNDCRVWAWGVCEVGNPDYFEYGNSIDTFFDYMKSSNNSTFYFHNAKFDCEFIIYHLFSLGFKHVERREDLDTKTFTTLISDKGQFYSMRIVFERKGKKTNAVTILDSLKILPFSVAQIAKGFNLPISKLKIDYKEYREKGHILTPVEVNYLRNDVDIVARALNTLFEQGLDKMTQASNAMFDYMRTVGEKNFKRWFPTPDYDTDKDIRQSYKGGFTYMNPKYKNVDIGEGLVLDVNSLYPSVMHDCPLPYGEGIHFKGKYEQDDDYNLYVQMFTCNFELKEGYLPTIQLKQNLSFVPTQYLTSSKNNLGIHEDVTLCLTSVDLEIFLEHYEIYNVVWHSGWKFRSATGMFSQYIDKWTEVKIESTRNGNKAMRTLAKLMLNALYGRFALNPKVASKYPYLDDGVIKYRTGEDEIRPAIYIPVGTFITAHARAKTIKSAQQVYPIFAYADTDSLHLDLKLPEEMSKMTNDELEKLTTADLQRFGVPIPDNFIVDPYALGAWKIESRFTRARFIRAKTYLEDWNTPETWDAPQFSTKEVKATCEEKGLDFNEEIKKYKGWYDKDLLNITCAGMPEQCYQYVSWNNFYEGARYAGKLQPKHVQGGIVLIDIDFTIQKG